MGKNVVGWVPVDPAGNDTFQKMITMLGFYAPKQLLVQVVPVYLYESYSGVSCIICMLYTVIHMPLMLTLHREFYCFHGYNLRFLPCTIRRQPLRFI